MTDPTPEPRPSDWQDWETTLVDAVLGLHDGAAVVVAAPAEHARTARPSGGRLRWVVGARRTRVVPSVRLVRVEDHLRGHWAGAERDGGPFPWTREEEETILRLGWHRPTSGDGEDYVRFWPDDVPQGPYLPLADARRAVRVVAATFREVLGITPEPAGAGLPTVRPSADD